MHELVSPQQAEAIVRGAAIALIAVGVLGCAAAAALPRRRRPGLAVGSLVTVAGALVYVLWAVYNGIVARFGLDSVKALLVNLGIFAVAGLVYGLAAGRAWRWAAQPADRKS
ncbi:MAG: hypothetical protein JSV65_13780 [Armatimonadota bacterium]|nr:MAG: hypothetical protein JSV65_13780 [Armatimonadota bacterium]